MAWGRWCLRVWHRSRVGVTGRRAASGRREGDSTLDRESPLRALVEDASAFSESTAGEGELEWATQPYTSRAGRDVIDMRPKTDPRDTTILLFPGQGSQFVGMGKKLLDIPPAKDVYDFASEVLGWDVARVCVEGPEEEVAARCQQCVVVTSLAAAAALRDARPGAVERCAAAAGFSLGEVAALTWAGALSLERALRLVEVRAAAMAAAAAARRGALLTVWLAADARLSAALAAAKEHAATLLPHEPVCQIANYLYPNCKVIGGDEAAIAWVEREGRAWGVRRSARVAVAGAFHTPLMEAAREPLRAALDLCDVAAPRLPVISNVDAKPYRDAKHIKTQLPKQLVRPVQWEQSLQALYARRRSEAVPLTVCLGPAAATRATLRQVNARAHDRAIHIDV